MGKEYKLNEFNELCRFIKDVKKIDNINLRDIDSYYDEFIKWKDEEKEN